MRRRDFLKTGGATALAACAPAASACVLQQAGDEAAIQRLIEDSYAVFFQQRDRKKYRAMLDEGYLLLEHGELMDVEAEDQLIPAEDSDYRRTDKFDFRQVRIAGDVAWTTYFLTSDIHDKKRGPRHIDFLESAVLRRSAGQWKIALLHSTRIGKK